MRQVVDLRRKWAFVMAPQEVPSAMPKPAYYVNLPHTWNAIDGQDGEGDYFRGTCAYIKNIPADELPKGENVFLEIGGASSSADVYVQGKHLAHHDGGYSIWRVDLSEHVNRGGDTSVVIMVDNSPRDDVYPQMADFTFYGGLYRDVKLIGVPESHFDLMHFGGPGVAVTPTVEGKDARVKTEVYLSGAKKGQMLRYTIAMPCGRVVYRGEASAEKQAHEAVIRDVHLWHGSKYPYLYTLTVELADGEQVLDSVTVRFGCRTFDIDPQKGFYLNGEHYPLRGVSRHQDRWGIGNALLEEHHKEDMELIAGMGANTIRLAHYQHDQAFYDLCDEYGMIVWAEIPYISQHMPKGRKNTMDQMKELIIQNYNHPSIVVWGLSNEITMKGAEDPDLIDNHRELNALCHRLDPTRKTVVAAVSMCPTDAEYLRIPDAVAYNHYFGWYGGDTSMNGPWFDDFHAKHPEIPVGASEYGCEALDWHTSKPAQGDYTEEYQAYYHEELIKQLFTRPYIWATYVWNMFDFGADNRMEGGENGQNHKGLVTFDRRYKKDSYFAYKAWLSDEPFVHICSKRYVDRAEDMTQITVYSNLPEAELFANGKSLGKKTSEEHFFYFDVPVSGEVKLKAVAGDCTDESMIRRIDAFNETYRLKEKGAVLNWFDITEAEGHFSLNDKLGDILKTKEGKALLAGMISSVKGGNAAGFEMTEDMMKMMNGFTVLRLTSLMGAMDVKFTKEQLLEMNAKLNQIRKP